MFSRPPPRSCDTFVAFPPAAAGDRVVFGKNSDRPADEVQEVVYFPAAAHPPGAALECTYIRIEQAARTHAVVLSRPAWLWGAEMGANEHGVCIGNEAVWGREEVCDGEALLGMDLVRFAQALLVNGGVRNISNQLSITTKIDREHPELKEYAKSKGWWDGEKEFDFAATYSYVNTARMTTSRGRYCEGYKLLNQHKGSITSEIMMEILRDKESGINMEGGFMTTGSMVSVLPQQPNLPCIHFFTGTPDPARSVFKPFIFVPNITQLLKTSSPTFGHDDPVKKQPRFQNKPDRRHELYKKHESAAVVMETIEGKGKEMLKEIQELEKQKRSEMESILQKGCLDINQVVNLFSQNSSSLILFRSNDQYVTLLLLSVARDKLSKQQRKKIWALRHDQAG
ncbi:secernin-3 isoform X3 [Nyctibius grandis]|uniref:secernin-3 isoform X3 n=1 Tax=Nyctibius grandis TaxID=48427 RepID=UPI0035BC7BBD